MHHGPIWQSEKGVFLRVLVRPNSRDRSLVHTISDDEIILSLKSPAREGKANTELVKRLAKALGISTGNLTIVAGMKGREKTILIQEIDLEIIKERLAELITIK